jgi:phosphatidylglycerol lysyltransferase
MRDRAIQAFRLALALAAVVVAAWLARREIGDLTWSDVGRALADTDPWRIAASAGLLAAGYGFLAIIEYYAFAYAGRRLGWRQAALGSTYANAVSTALGFGLLTGSAMRLQIYRPAGVSARQIGGAVLIFSVGSFLGGVVLLGLALAAQPSVWRERPTLLLLAGLLLLPAAAWFVAGRGRDDRVRLSVGERILALAAVVGDWLCTAFGLLVLTEGAGAPLPFLTRFATGALIGQAAGAPGGLGPLEAAILGGASGDDVRRAVAALILFRVIFFLAPAVLATPFWLASSLRNRARLRKS